MSNGAMMSITPLAIWSRHQNVEWLQNTIRLVVSFTHGKREMHDLCTAYCLAIRTLIKNANDQNRANLAQNAVQTFALKSDPIVNKWFLEARQLHHDTREIPTFFGLEHYNTNENQGFCKHAFVLAFFCLMRSRLMPIEGFYDWAMMQTVKL